MEDLEKYGIKNPELLQIIQIVVEGTNVEGETIQILLSSNRRVLPIPYTEQP